MDHPVPFWIFFGSRLERWQQALIGVSSGVLEPDGSALTVVNVFTFLIILAEDEINSQYMKE